MSVETIAFIPMRSGSMSIINKNVKAFFGKPLFAWGIGEALKSGCFDEVIISTDSVEYCEIFSKYFCASQVKIDLRPKRLGSDSTSTEEVLLEFFNRSPEYISSLCVLHQVTSPFVTAENFQNIVNSYHDNSYDSLLSAVLFKRFIWDKTSKPVNYNPADRPRRQDMDDYYCENGALYAFNVKSFLEEKCRLYGNIGIVTMPDESLIELDEPVDWAIAERLFEEFINE